MSSDNESSPESAEESPDESPDESPADSPSSSPDDSPSEEEEMKSDSEKESGDESNKSSNDEIEKDDEGSGGNVSELFLRSLVLEVNKEVEGVGSKFPKFDDDNEEMSSGEEDPAKEIDSEDDLKLDSGSSVDMDLSDTESEGEKIEVFENEEEKFELLKDLVNQKTDRGLKVNRRGEFYFTETQLQYTAFSIFCMCFGCCSYTATIICVFFLMLIPIVTESFAQFWDFWWIFLLLVSPVICCCMCFCCCFLCLKTYWVRITFSDHNQLMYIQRGNLIPILTSTKVVRYDKISRIRCVEGIRTPWEDVMGRFYIGIKKFNGNTLCISTPYIKRKKCERVASTMNECLLNHVHL